MNIDSRVTISQLKKTVWDLEARLDLLHIRLDNLERQIIGNVSLGVTPVSIGVSYTR